MAAQVQCYQHILDKYGPITEWQLSIDMDEYPFVHGDTREGFLLRFLATVKENVSEVSLPNFILLGQGDRSKGMVIERITRIKDNQGKKSNNLDKPLYRTKYVSAGIHHMRLLKGRRQEENGMTIKMLHYWGARHQNWGPDTEQTFLETEEFTDARDALAPVLRQSLLAFGEFDAFCNSTGP